MSKFYFFVFSACVGFASFNHSLDGACWSKWEKISCELDNTVSYCTGDVCPLTAKVRIDARFSWTAATKEIGLLCAGFILFFFLQQRYLRALTKEFWDSRHSYASSEKSLFLMSTFRFWNGHNNHWITIGRRQLNKYFHRYTVIHVILYFFFPYFKLIRHFVSVSFLTVTLNSSRQAAHNVFWLAYISHTI